MANRIGKYKLSKKEQALYDSDASIINTSGTNLTLSGFLKTEGNGTQLGNGVGDTLGFFGTTPIVQNTTAITQIYSTAVTTHAAATALAPPAGGTGATAGAYDNASNRDLMITSVTALRTDFIMLQGVVNKLIDDLQALGLLKS